MYIQSKRKIKFKNIQIRYQETELETSTLDIVLEMDRSLDIFFTLYCEYLFAHDCVT